MTPTTIKTIFVLLIAISAWGQTTIRGTTTITSDGVVSDTINRSPNRDFEKRINLGPIDSSSFDFEIRFYKLSTVTTKRNLRLVRCIDGQWESFEFDEIKESKIIKRAIVPTIGYDRFLSNLTKYNFTTLPNHSDLDKKIQDSYASKKEYLQSRPSILDGYEFIVEFKISDKFRVYQFYNPESYIKYYDNIELKDYVSIEQMFEKDLVRK